MKGKQPIIEPCDTTTYRDQEQENWQRKLISEIGQKPKD